MVRRDSEHWNEAAQAELDAWLRASTAHRVAFVRLSSAWTDAARIKLLAVNGLADCKGGDATVDAPISRLAVRVPWYQRALPVFSGTAVAAGLLLVAGLAGWLRWPTHGTDYHTDVGGLSAIAVRDGSTITLNTDSGIRIDLSNSERRVDLDKGEAFFEVAKDPSRPFVVRVGDQRVTAVGTKFSVRREQNSIRVIVTEGKVRIEHQGSQQPSETAMITPGGVAVAGNAGVLVQNKPLSDAEERLSWRKGTLVFRDTPLNEAVAEFNRYAARPIDIEDPAIGSLRIGGQFRTNNAQGFVRLLAEAFPIEVDATDKRIVLRRR